VNREKLIVNLVDKSVLADSFIESIMRCSNNPPGSRTPTKIEYVHNQSKWGGVSLFTDKVLHMAPNIDSPFKAAILIEPRELIPSMYQTILQYSSYYDLILTYDEELLCKLSHKTEFMCPDSSVHTEEVCKISEKTKLLSMVYSNKQYMSGHKLRHVIAKDLLPKIGYHKMSLYGTGCGKPILTKAEGTVDYMFQMAIENSQKQNYFSDKILDCVACGTVPIYWGCENIGDFFDKRGIIQFNTLDELTNILPTLSREKYEQMKPYIKTNYEIFMKNYFRYDDLMCEKILKFYKI